MALYDESKNPDEGISFEGLCGRWFNLSYDRYFGLDRWYNMTPAERVSNTLLGWGYDYYVKRANYDNGIYQECSGRDTYVIDKSFPTPHCVECLTGLGEHFVSQLMDTKMFGLYKKRNGMLGKKATNESI